MSLARKFTSVAFSTMVRPSTRMIAPNMIFHSFSTDNNKNNETTSENANNSDENSNSASSPIDAQTSADKALIDKLQKEVKDLKDQVLRCYAEEENVRRIAKVCNISMFVNILLSKFRTMKYDKNNNST
jgi:hypothetical protein